MSTRFFTNHGEQTLFKKFQGVFQSNPDIEWFDALVGFLRASGYFAIRPYLEKVPNIRILVGINVDAIMAIRFSRRAKRPFLAPRVRSTPRQTSSFPSLLTNDAMKRQE